ncbi:MAG TPA: hypothetical protein ENL10_03830, partial [Candidatus Cloacimonetes bacterium]|nr:hypothetical protein [Candidatus Cloacimonadota bacterium]
MIAKKLNYGMADIYRMSTGTQDPWRPPWRQNTEYGDRKPPNRGIERPRSSQERQVTVADLGQAFSNRFNHEFETMVHAVEKICLKDTCFTFFLGTTIGEIEEDHWFSREIFFTKPVFEKGSRKQDYPVITYYEEYDGGTYVSTGYGMVIPFEKLFNGKNGAKGKYSVDKFLMQGFEAIALGFRDFYYVYFMELALNMEDQYIRYLKREKRKFRTIDEYLEFNEKILGILNSTERKDKKFERFPVEMLIKEIEKHVKNYNHTWGANGNKIGIVLDENIIHAERYKPHNHEYMYIGPKKGTFRNTDTLDEGEDIWETAKLKAVIFGLSRFKDAQNPNGICPLQKTIRYGYWCEMPDFEEVVHKDKTELYSSNHHDIKAIEPSTGIQG